MPLTITVLHPRRILKATAEGLLDYQEIHRIAPALEEAAESLPDHDILLETQRTHSVLTTTDLWHLAADLGQRTSSHHRKFAIVCAPDRIDLVRTMEAAFQKGGPMVRVFDSTDEAWDWLGEASPVT